MAAPRPPRTPEERDDHRLERQRLIVEARRLCRRSVIADFIREHCEIVDESDQFPPQLYYDYTSRNRSRLINELKQLIRDNLNPSITRANAPWAYGDVEDKITVLEKYVRDQLVDDDDKPWNVIPRNFVPEVPYGQGQGQGNPNN